MKKLKDNLKFKYKNMKKLIFFLLIGGLVLTLSACTNQNNADNALSDDAANLNSAIMPIKQISNSISNITMKTPDQQEDLLKQYSQAVIKTSLGDITVKFYASDSPVTVNNFLNLAKEGFYDDTRFHRVIKDFMIQAGDPLSKENNTSLWGTGGPGYQFKDEFNAHKLVVGSLAMANSGPATNGSQFFIVTAESTPWLDGHHTNFGEVVSGMDIVKKIETVTTGPNDRPATDISINSIVLVK